MKLSKAQFKSQKNKRITLLGMSGVGKTHLAKLIGQAGDWFHFSGDYHIGATHLTDEIVDNIALKMKKDPWLQTLLNNNSISVNSQITFDNLEPISAFLGKAGNPEEGGLPIDEFTRRQALFRDAEIKAMLDVPKFIERALNQGQEHFINDAGGSLCELNDERVYETLAEHTLILYVKTSSANEKVLIKRAQSHPKPLYYQTDFFQEALNTYLSENELSYVAQMNPDAFVRWVFPKLVANRLPKYQAIADQYGYTISSDALYHCKTADDVFTLIDEALD
ncbi:MAG: ATPase [Gammaproteobacteria bacterium]|nr:ATPase [Gammaproteobacteria bacterium]